jgi:hypothetical protein
VATAPTVAPALLPRPCVARGTPVQGAGTACGIAFARGGDYNIEGLDMALIFDGGLATDPACIVGPGRNNKY